MKKPKHLNSSKPILRPMGQTGYSSTANSTYETSKLASRGICAVAGLAAIVGSAYSGMAQDVQPITYRDTNLSQYGVPSVEGLKPYLTRHFDLTDKIPGNETRMDVFRTDDAMIGIFSANGQMFQIGYDQDFKAPTDVTYRDSTGDGRFEPYNPQSKVVIPEWVLR